MTMKMSEAVTKVQKAVDTINVQAGRPVLGEPLMDRGCPTVMVMFGSLDFSVAVDRQEIVGKTDQELVDLIEIRLGNTLLRVESNLEQDLKKLGYVE